MEPKTIGIVGLTAEGASLCYRTIVSESARLLGTDVHPPIVLHNPSLHLTNDVLRRRDWPGLGALVIDSISKLVSIGAEIIIMPANAAHYAASYFLAASPVPFLSIVEVSANACVARGFKRVAILGIGITMSDGLYEQPLRERGIEAVIPTSEEQATVNRVIFEEIIPMRATSETSRQIVEVIRRLKARGADAVILGCTELPIVITEANSPLPFVDTTRLLAHEALKYALRGDTGQSMGTTTYAHERR
jgi:aspartate racemase